MTRNYFFSTYRRGVSKIQDVLVDSTCLHASRDKEVAFLSPDEMPSRSVMPSIGQVKLLLQAIFLLVFAQNRLCLIRYRSVLIGRYAVASAYRSYKSYKSRFLFALKYIKALHTCSQLIHQIEPHLGSIDSAFIDHGCYQNGVYFELFTELGIPIYFNDYPYGLIRWEPKQQGGYDLALQVDPRQIESDELEQGKSALDARIRDSGKIDYLSVDYVPYQASCDFDYVIYTHSFTDAQNMYGYDGAFNNVMEWLDFTLKVLKHKRVCIKGHPGIYTNGHSAQVVEWDRMLFEQIAKTYRSKDNVEIIDYPVSNFEFLSALKKETVLISHHSNALLEGGGLGFKCICASATNWKKFPIFNTWSDKKSYRSLLHSSYDQLKETDSVALYSYYYILYFDRASFFKWHWFREVARVSSVAYKDLFVDASCVEHFSIDMMDSCVKGVVENLVTR